MEETMSVDQSSSNPSAERIGFEVSLEIEFQNIEKEITSSISEYRKKAEEFFELGLYDSSEFFSNKLALFSENNPQDIYGQAKSMCALQEHYRAIALLRRTKVHEKDIYCRYLLTQCLYHVKEYAEALSLLNNEDKTAGRIFQTLFPMEDDIQSPKEDDTLNTVYSALFVLKGKTYEALDNRKQAAVCYKQALRFDVNCYSAIQTLVERYMVTKNELWELLSSLPWKEGNTIHKLTYKLYAIIYSSFLPEKERKPLDIPKKLRKCVDVTIAEAENLYNNYLYKQCLEITDSVLRQDPYNKKCIPLHVCCLLELGLNNKLYYLAHNLMDVDPEGVLSWYVAGCYYYNNGKQETARKYLSKALAKDSNFGLAWLLFGHTYAADNEHDQAMTAYFKANEVLFKSHLPLLYIGLECSFNNNIDIATKFMEEALKLAPNDPFILHELSVVSFHAKKYQTAEAYALKALQIIEPIKGTSSKWEPLYYNLGHVELKLNKLADAMEFFEQALLLSPLNASTMSYIAFVKAKMGLIMPAIESLHESLAICPKMEISSTLLNALIDHAQDNEDFLNLNTDVNDCIISKARQYISRIGASSLIKASETSVATEHDYSNVTGPLDESTFANDIFPDILDIATGFPASFGKDSDTDDSIYD